MASSLVFRFNAIVPIVVKQRKSSPIKVVK